MSNFQLGIRFCPTDEELIMYYLKNKVKNQPLPSGWDRVMIVRDIYCEKGTPWILFRDDDPWQTPVDTLGKVPVDQKEIYVFTKLSNVGKTGKKNKNSCGQWHGNAAAEHIKKKGELIGKKRTFTFRSEEKTFGQWTMHEYFLDGASLEGLNPEDSSLVLCRIKRDDSKSSIRGKLVSQKGSRSYDAIESNDREVIEATNKRSVSSEDIDQFGSNKKLRISDTDSSVQELMISNTSTNYSSIVTTGTPQPASSSSNMNYNEVANIASSSTGSVVDETLGDIGDDPSNYANLMSTECNPRDWVDVDLINILRADSSMVDGDQINRPIEQTVTSATDYPRDESLSAACILRDQTQSMHAEVGTSAREIDQEANIVSTDADAAIGVGDYLLDDIYLETDQEANIVSTDSAIGVGDYLLDDIYLETDQEANIVSTDSAIGVGDYLLDDIYLETDQEANIVSTDSAIGVGDYLLDDIYLETEQEANIISTDAAIGVEDYLLDDIYLQTDQEANIVSTDVEVAFGVGDCLSDFDQNLDDIYWEPPDDNNLVKSSAQIYSNPSSFFDVDPSCELVCDR